MLYALTEYLKNYISGFNAFGYITLRAVMAMLTALVISLACGPVVIRWLTRLKVGQAVRDDGPQTHLVKAGTPTMGGTLILISTALAVLCWSDLSNRYLWIVLGVMLGNGAIGFVDDYKKVALRNPKGLSARYKILWQSLIAIAAGLLLAYVATSFTPARAPLQTAQSGGYGDTPWVLADTADPARITRMSAASSAMATPPAPPQVDTTPDNEAARAASFTRPPTIGAVPSAPGMTLIVPFFKQIVYPFGLLGFLVLTYFVIVGSSNAVNLTDGLDGLAILPTVMIAAALAVFAYVTGNIKIASYLLLPYIPGTGELAIFCAAIAGAGLGFLWFNAYPAEVFMGDVGALALGSALGTIAVIVRQEVVFFVMSGVFVMETISVIVQVASFKLTGRRVFRMAPLHHHYELKGWKETQVVVRFWIITMMLVLAGLSTLKLR